MREGGTPGPRVGGSRKGHRHAQRQCAMQEVDSKVAATPRDVRITPDATHITSITAHPPREAGVTEWDTSHPPCVNPPRCRPRCGPLRCRPRGRRGAAAPPEPQHTGQGRRAGSDTALSPPNGSCDGGVRRGGGLLCGSVPSTHTPTETTLCIRQKQSVREQCTDCHTLFPLSYR